MTGDIESKAITTLPERVIKVIEIINPLRMDNRTVRLESWSANKPLSAYIPDDGGEYVASISGGVVLADQWDTTYPLSDDTIVICPVLGGGGGGGKMILRLIALIAIVVFQQYYLTPYLLGAGFSAAAVALIGGAFVVAGGMLVNALLPVQPASLGKPSSDLQESPSYGINGAVNTSEEGISVPVVYGQYRIGGNIIGFYTENQGKNQILYMLFNAGEGPVAGLSDIEINGQPLTAFQDVQIEVRTGTPDQSSIKWFQNTVTLKDAGSVVIPVGNLPDDAMPARVTTQPVDRLRVDVIAQSGLYHVNDKGEIENWQVPLKIGYAPCDSAGVVPLGAQFKYDFGVATVSHYGPEYHYIGQLIYDPNTGEPDGPAEEDIEYNLRPGDRVIESIHSNPWTDGYEYKAGEAIPATGAIRGYLCTADHTASSTNAPTQPGGAAYWRPLVLSSWGVDTVVNFQGKYSGYRVIVPEHDELSGETTISGRSRYPIRTSFFSPRLESSYYKVQIARQTDPSTDDNTADEVRWETLGEILMDNVSYRNTALVGLKIRLSDQLTQLPTVTHVNHGVITRYYDQADGLWKNGSTGNPAWAALDMLTNMRYGARIPWQQIDVNAFADWAAYCDAQEPPLRFDAVLDQSMAFWDAMKYVGRCGHAQITRNGTRFSVVIERAEDPVMVFSEANILKGSFNVNYISMEERANSVEVTYWDKNSSYERKTLKVIDPNVSDLAFERTAALTLLGVTDRERAIREGWLQLNMNNWITRTIEFEAGLDAIACVPGSVITVKHVAQETAFSGRFAGNGGSTGGSPVELDSEITLQSGVTYKGIAVAPTGILWTSGSGHTVLAVDTARNAVTIANAMTSVNKPGILTIGGTAFSVASWAQSPANSDDGIAALAPGQDVGSITIGANTQGTGFDMIIEADVTGTVGVPITSVTWTGPTVTEGWQFIIGPVETVQRNYRVVSIDPGGNDHTRAIKAIEYHPEVYAASGYVPIPPVGDGNPGSTTDTRQVVNLEIQEGEVPTGPNPRFQMELHWDPPTIGTYSGAKVYRLEDGAADWSEFTTVTNGAVSHRFDAAIAEHLVFKVLAIDGEGMSPAFSGAPRVETVVGSTTTTAVQPTGLFAQTGFQTIYLGWTVDKPDYLGTTKLYALHAVGSSPPSDPESAELITEVPGLSYVFSAQEGNYRFYIKVVDKFGRESDFYPLPDGVECSAVMLVSDMMDLLDDQIYASLLDQALREHIQLIPDLINIDTFVRSLDAILNMGLLGDENGAAVRTLQSTVVTESQATAQSITQLQARIDNADAAIQQEMIVRASEDNAEATLRTVLAARVDGIENSIGDALTTVAGIEDVLQVHANEISAEAQARRTLAARLTGTEDGSSIESGSYIYDMQQTIVDAQTASAQAIEQLRSNLVFGDPNHPEDPSFTSLSAGITSVSNTVTGLTRPGGAITLLASRVDQLWVSGTTPSGEIWRAIEQRALVSDTQAQWYLKIEAGGPDPNDRRVAGFGLGWEAGTDIFDFIVRTDRFAIGDVQGTKDYPFIVADIPGSVPPHKGVFIRDAFIQNAAVDTLKIRGNAVSIVASGETSVTVNVGPGESLSAIAAASVHGTNNRLYAGLQMEIRASGVVIGQGSDSLYFGNHDTRSFDMSTTAAGSWTNTSSTTRTMVVAINLSTIDGNGGFPFTINNSSIFVSVLKR